MTQRLANIVFCVALIGTCCVLFTMALGFRDNDLLGVSELSSRFFPLLMLSFIMVCAAVVVGQYAVAGEAGDESGYVYSHWTEPVRALLVLCLTFASYRIWQDLGFVPMSLFIGPALCAAMAAKSILSYVFLLAFGPAVYFVFRNALGVQLG